jgi:hypothetical protein
MIIDELLITLKMLDIDYEIVDNEVFILNPYLDFDDPEGFNVLSNILEKSNFNFAPSNLGYDYLLSIIIGESKWD